MKKWKIFIIALFVILMVSAIFVAFSNHFNSEPTDKFYMDVTILENGDIKVKELAKLTGSYHGRTRTIEYINSDAQLFTGQQSDFDGSSIYNGSGITIDKVADVVIDKNFSFDSMNHLNRIFTRSYETPQVAYQVYEQEDTSYATSLKIYNPDRMKTAFYIEYTIKDAVVVHEDVAELAWNLLGDQYEENIGTFEVRVHLPRADDDYRVWLKGPLNGEVEKKDNRTAVATYDFLGARNPVSIRLMFDKDLVSSATKKSYTYGKSYILKTEQAAAEKANQEREEYKASYSRIKAILFIWFICLFASICYLKITSSKNKKADFQQEYLREFPAAYGPEVLEYLLEKNVSEASFSATILSLVDKKVLTVQEEKNKNKTDYILTWNGKEENLGQAEKQVLDLLIKDVGNGKEVSLEAFKKYGKSTRHAEKMMDAYQNFIDISVEKAKEENFFQQTPLSKILTIILAFLGILIAFVVSTFDMFFAVIAIFALSLLALLYALSIYFYTAKGREDLAKWNAFKKFLEDFSTFDEKELPEVPLWNKYLVYASVLGCAETLQKQMKLKLDTMNQSDIYNYDPILIDRVYLYHTMSHSISQSVHTAVASSRSSIAASRSSSGGGSGGGASFGGGSFGGGGGGGRF